MNRSSGTPLADMTGNELRAEVERRRAVDLDNERLVGHLDTYEKRLKEGAALLVEGLEKVEKQRLEIESLQPKHHYMTKMGAELQEELFQQREENKRLKKEHVRQAHIKGLEEAYGSLVAVLVLDSRMRAGHRESILIKFCELCGLDREETEARLLAKDSNV